MSLCNVNFLPWAAIRAKTGILVVALVADVFIAVRASVVVLSHFVLRSFEGLFVFFLPFGRTSLESFGENIAGTLTRPAEV
jgi:hypothetical protein